MGRGSQRHAPLSLGRAGVYLGADPRVDGGASRCPLRRGYELRVRAMLELPGDQKFASARTPGPAADGRLVADPGAGQKPRRHDGIGLIQQHVVALSGSR